jgi:hypothetical protein
MGEKLESISGFGVLWSHEKHTAQFDFAGSIAIERGGLMTAKEIETKADKATASPSASPKK